MKIHPTANISIHVMEKMSAKRLKSVFERVRSLYLWEEDDELSDFYEMRFKYIKEILNTKEHIERNKNEH